MSSDPVIRAESLGKTFRMYARPVDRLWQFLWGGHKRLFNDFVALRDVGFELRPGEVLGIVGVNGAGKSTLLQLIAGTIAPSQGRLHTRGRVAALLELGSGFNPEFTGRENIYLNAAVLGLQKAEIDARLQSIIAFADIGAHIDQPVKTYSSGMYIRLAFAIATSVDADILIVDEALSVGDGAFARKSFDRIMEIKARGATVLFCSHTLYHVEVFCDQALWLHQGQVQAQGEVSSVLSRYQEFLDNMSQPTAQTPTTASSAAQPPAVGESAPVTGAPSHPEGHARIRSVRVLMDGHEGQELYGKSGVSSLGMQIEFSSDPQLPAPSAALVISSDGGRILATHIAADAGSVIGRDASGQGTARVVVPALPLNKGRYRIGAYLMCERGVHVYQWIDPVAHVQMHRDGHDQGYFVLSASWSSGEEPAAVAAQATTTAQLQQVAGHWDAWSESRPATGQQWTDWGDHPTVFRAVMHKAFGSQDEDFFSFLRKHFPQTSGAHALSLCCGDGRFEVSLVQNGVFDRITGLEWSSRRIEQGQEHLRTLPQEISHKVQLLQHDVNRGDFGEGLYDVVFAKAALHHIMALEPAFAGIERCLRPGGLLVTIDFFGPSRFQWTDAQLQAVEDFWQTRVPPALRHRADGSELPPIVRPTVQDMIDMDPSEAAHSDELMACIRQRFEVLHDIALGGTLMNLLLYGERVNQFDPDNAVHNAVLQEAVDLEHKLMAQGLLGSDFRFVVARRRKQVQ